jgi:hypothetical protein
MATPTLVATAGASNANTYCTLAEAETYMDSRLHVDAWDEAVSDDKNKGLLWATSLLDDLVTWYGWKSTTGQALRWPRTGVYNIDGESISSLQIPQFLKDATAEFAFQLLSEDRTLETNRDLMGFESMTVGPLSLKIDPNTKKPILPMSVQNMIRNYTPAYNKEAKTLVRM